MRKLAILSGLLWAFCASALGAAHVEYVAVTGEPYLHAAYEFDDSRAGAYCADVALFERTEDGFEQQSIAGLLAQGTLKQVELYLHGYQAHRQYEGRIKEHFDQPDGRRTFCLPYLHRGFGNEGLMAASRVELTGVKTKALVAWSQPVDRRFAVQATEFEASPARDKGCIDCHR
ncbi:hypothetical protein [Ferrimonas pelagia]|uniref:Uncharacterized protein n=1 Tax=Ferrimonas pelagia TaxID=1177826 RepID=A0ABP9F665_9GAMM